MWLYLKPPPEAPTLYLLLEEIRQKDPPFDTAVVSEGLMDLVCSRASHAVRAYLY